MNAQSLVVATRSLAERAESVLDEQRLFDDTAIRERGLSQLATVCSIDALVAASTPLPVPESASHQSADETVATLIGHLYVEEALEEKDLDDELRNQAAEIDRVRKAGSFLQIPLSTDERYEHNWRPVFRFVMGRLDAVTDNCERIVARLEGEVPEPATALRIWRTSVDMLQETRTVLRIQLQRQERLAHLYNRPAREPVEFAAWTIEQLTDTPTQS